MYDLAAFCLICFETDNKLESVCANDSEILENLKKLGYETDWLISETPIKICNSCICLLSVTTNFQHMCIKNNRLLKLYTDKLKYGALNQRASLQVLTKRNQKIFCRKYRNNYKKVNISLKRPLKSKRQPKVSKSIKSIIDCSLECRVSLEQICKQRLKNGNRATFSEKIKVEECESRIKDGAQIEERANDAKDGTQIEKRANDGSSAPKPTTPVVNIVKESLVELFPSPQDANLRKILKSLERISKISKNNTSDVQANETPTISEVKTFENKSRSESSTSTTDLVKPGAERVFIDKLKNEFKFISKTLIAYSNKQLHELITGSDSNVANISETKLPEQLQSTELGSTVVQSKYLSVQPVPLSKLVESQPCATIPPYQNNNHISSYNANLNLQKPNSPKRCPNIGYPNPVHADYNNSFLKHKSNVAESAAQLNGSRFSNYLNVALTTPNVTATNMYQLADNDVRNQPSKARGANSYENNSDIEIISDSEDNDNAVTPDYDDAIVASLISNEGEAAESSLNDSQQNNMEIANDFLLNCEVLLGDSNAPSLVLTEHCVLCDTMLNNPNSNYCQLCFNRLNQNLLQENRKKCINCDSPLDASNSSLFCVKCAAIGTLTQADVFGKKYSQCVACCKIYRNTRTEVIPNILCCNCQHHGLMDDMHLFNCEFCDYKFLFLLNYEVHKKEHDIKKFECSLCLQRFRAKGNLSTHYQGHMQDSDTVHKCTECGRVFSKHHQLKMHLKLHYGVKDVKCLYCDEMFVLTKQRRHHMVSEHPEQLMSKKKIVKS